MDTELLKTFLEVQKTRHFGKAAENLYLTQSAVSFRIRQLEQSLGVALFTRFRNNIQLTNAGELLLPHARAVIQAMLAAKQQLLSLSGKPQPYQWQVANELAFLLQQLPTWPVSSADNLQVQFLSSTTALQEPIQQTDGYIGFATNNPVLESSARYSLGFLKLIAVSSHHDPKHEVHWELPFTVPHLRDAGFAFVSTDVYLVRNYLKCHDACGYLPSALIEHENFHQLPIAPVWLEVCAFAPIAAEWPAILAQQLQTAALLAAATS